MDYISQEVSRIESSGRIIEEQVQYLFLLMFFLVTVCKIYFTLLQLA